jgi:hypothetical protein
MISAHLAILNTENRGSFSEHHLILFLQSVELPLDEFVIIRVIISSDKGSSKVDIHPKMLQILFAQTREILEPVVRVFKFLNLVLGNPHVFQNLALGRFLCGEVVETVFGYLVFDSVGSGGDGHACAVEGLGEKDVVALDLLVTGSELALGHGEGVAEVETAVHVGVGEGDHVFLGVGGRVHLVAVGFQPVGLRLVLDFEQAVAARE